MTTEIYAVVVNSIRKCIPKPLQVLEITSDSKLKDDLGVDSLTLMMLTLELEKNAGVKLNSHVERLVQARTVNDIEKLIGMLQSQVEHAQ